MDTRELRSWLTQKMKEAEPLDAPSQMEHPNRVALKAAKEVSLLGCCDLDFYNKADEVKTPQQCAAYLAACLNLLPEEYLDANILDANDVASALRITFDEVMELIESGKLAASSFNAGGQQRCVVRRESLDQFLRKQEIEQKQLW